MYRGVVTSRETHKIPAAATRSQDRGTDQLPDRVSQVAQESISAGAATYKWYLVPSDQQLPFPGFLPGQPPLLGLTPPQPPFPGFLPGQPPLLGLTPPQPPFPGFLPGQPPILRLPPPQPPFPGFLPGQPPILGLPRPQLPFLGFFPGELRLQDQPVRDRFAGTQNLQDSEDATSESDEDTTSESDRDETSQGDSNTRQLETANQSPSKSSIPTPRLRKPRLSQATGKPSKPRARNSTSYGEDSIEGTAPGKAGKRKIKICKLHELICKNCTPPITFDDSREFYRHCKAAHPSERTKCWEENCLAERRKARDLVGHFIKKHALPDRYTCGGINGVPCEYGYQVGAISSMRKHYLARHFAIHQDQERQSLQRHNLVLDKLEEHPEKPKSFIYTCTLLNTDKK